MTNDQQKAQQKAKTEAFRALHQGKILILPNAWDAASARIVQQAGFSAIATTSAGIAFTLGYPDGQRISREEMLASVGRIAHAVQVPVTADVEAGYGDRAEDAAETARAACRVVIAVGENPRRPRGCAEGGCAAGAECAHRCVSGTNRGGGNPV